MVSPLEYRSLKKLPPGLLALPVPILHRDQFLLSVGTGSNEHQQADSSIFETNIAVHAVSPDVDVVLLGEIPLMPLLVVLDPLLFEPADGVGR